MIAIYARVSTEEQAKKGFSLLDQVRECRKIADTSDVIEYVDEGVSGEFLDRPALSRLRGDVRKGIIDKVICLDPDRLSRKLMNQLILTDEIEGRAELVFVSGAFARTPEGQLFYQMRGAISQFEKAKINERMSRGRREKARQGRVLRDFRIYGYDFDSARDRFVINEQEAVIVRLVFDLFTNPQGRVRGINGIARYLTDVGVPTKRGAAVFHRQVVRQMLTNRAYIGEFYQNRWNTEGMLGNRYRLPEERIRQRERAPEEWIALPIPPLVERAVFDYAAALLAESRRRYAGVARTQYLLSGLLRCAGCGNTLTGVRRHNWGRSRTYYTDHKKTAGCRHPGCGIYLPTGDLEAQVWQAVLDWVGEPDAQTLAVLLADAEGTQTASLEAQMIARVEEELQRNRELCSRLLDLLEDPAVEKEDIRDKLREMSHKRAQLQQQREDLARQLTARPSLDEAASQWLYTGSSPSVDFAGPPAPFASQRDPWSVLQGAGALASDLQQQLLRTVVKEIRVHSDPLTLEIVTL